MVTFAALALTVRAQLRGPDLRKRGVEDGANIELWPVGAEMPSDTPIPASLRHRLYPQAPLRDQDLGGDRPFLRPFLAKNGARRRLPAILVFPGGGYGQLSPREGQSTCHFLNERAGIHAVLVHYRVQRRHPAPLLDARRAVQLVRAHAEEWHVDPDRVGVVGFSAGGHLAGHLALNWDCLEGNEVDRQLAATGDAASLLSARPVVAALSYPVVSSSGESTGLLLPAPGGRVGPYGLLPCATFSCVGDAKVGEGRPVRHHGSMEVLLGPPPWTEEAQADVSLELLVREHPRGGSEQGETHPPIFIWHAADDMVVPVQNSICLASALWQAQARVELHVFERGGAHGLGLARPQDAALMMARDTNASVSHEALNWTNLWLSWLRSNGFSP